MKTEKSLIDHYNENTIYFSVSGEWRRIFALLDVQASARWHLDLGCGTGQFVHEIKESMPKLEVTGVDYSYMRISEALHRTKGKVTLTCQDIHEFLGRTGDCWDVITLFDVLEHLEEPEQLISDCMYHLSSDKPDSCIVATVPVDDDYEAHLQVFKTEEDVQEALNPFQIVQARLCRKDYFLCKWIIR